MEGFQAVAKRFINTTRSHLFITGKAGTGKTTFLKNLDKITHKNFIVVAPTGIAALNAGGVTIHSQFLLPLGTFIPDRSLQGEHSESVPCYTQNALARNHPLNSARKQVLRSIDLLVIDEVSMLRADLLDAIDYRMRAARGNFRESFGGVQVLFIGDLYQLPPVVKRGEESVLNKYYKSPWFYEAKALEHDQLVFIEFDKIYRQHDQVFINLLNNLRDNTITQQDVDTLNQHYYTASEIEELKEVITLTTHNYKADELNLKALQSLPGKSHFLEANTEGEFPESMYPVLQRIELKVGAQIMFVRNDTDGNYYNGKLATVKEINGNEVWVELAGTNARFKLKRVRWENKKYALQKDNLDLDEEVIGSFEQYPVKLAWAITVHKSQGLTFDKAIIDVGQAFADGQVYVALSRLRTLDGLVLRAKIQSTTISTDKQIVSFVKENHQPHRLDEVMRERQKGFLTQLIEQTFDFSSLVRDLQYIIRSNETTLHKDSVRSVLLPVASALEAERENTVKYRKQLAGLLSDHQLLIERLGKGSDYYKALLTEKLKAVLIHQQEMQQLKRVKTYITQLTELDVAFTRKLDELGKVLVLTEAILNGNENIDVEQLKEQSTAKRSLMIEEIRKLMPEISVENQKKSKKGKKTRKDKTSEKSTYDISLDLFKSGMTVKEIATQRQLAVSTIEGHLEKGIASGSIPISTLADDETVREVSEAIATLPKGFSLKELFEKLNGRYGYGVLKAVVAHNELSKPE